MPENNLIKRLEAALKVCEGPDNGEIAKTVLLYALTDLVLKGHANALDDIMEVQGEDKANLNQLAQHSLSALKILDAHKARLDSLDEVLARMSASSSKATAECLSEAKHTLSRVEALTATAQQQQNQLAECQIETTKILLAQEAEIESLNKRLAAQEKLSPILDV